MGISDNDRAILENEVEIIFHVAATVNFNTSLREATYINVRSLDILLDMAKNMKNLKVRDAPMFRISAQLTLVLEPGRLTGVVIF